LNPKARFINDIIFDEKGLGTVHTAMENFYLLEENDRNIH